MKKIIIYTDGSCLGNPGPGGYGAIILHEGKETILRGGEQSTTNNRMEMLAIVESLKWVVKHVTDGEVDIFSDSSLVVNSMKEGWKRKANLDVWAEMDKAMTALDGVKINWNWVKGHSTNKLNERVDIIAVEESNKFEHVALPKELAEGFYCQKCNEKVDGRFSYNEESDMIRVDCEKCGSYIMFAEQNKENLAKAKKRILLTKAQIEEVKKIKESQGNPVSENELKKIKTWIKEEADSFINSNQTLF